jgi:hydroxyethylthiazole kinase-like uncharacterized protein yjeF
MRVLTAAESRAADRRAIEELGIAPLVLMENAALGVTDALGERFPEARRVAVVCGPGNNGGDGLAIARQLATRGYEVDVRLARLGRSLSADCAAQLASVRALGLAIEELDEAAIAGEPGRWATADLVVDALFGTGLARPLAGGFAALAEALAGCPRPVVAVDLPSGLDADASVAVGPAARAELTVTFGALKPAHVLAPACDRCGEIVVADLGVPLDAGPGPGSLHLLTGEELAAAIAPRAADAHKGAFGHLLLVAGSRGKAGAAVLAARAAVAGGAGLTTVAAPAELLAALVAGCPEAMAVPLPASASGALSLAALDALLAAAAERTTLAVGPGLGREDETGEVVRRLALSSDRPLVLDADGLFAFADRSEELAGRRAATVLTPHPGELARLLGRDTAAVQSDRLGAAREAARRSGAVVVLKGRRTIVAAPDGEAWVNETGNPGMASGGSGDVLTGLAAARLAQGEVPEFAAALSVHWHGLAGDLALARLGGPAVPASELVSSLGAAWRALVGA